MEVIDIFVAVTDNGIQTGKTLSELNKKLNSKLEMEEFKSAGSDYIIKLNPGDISFIQDKKRLSLIPIQNLYRKDTSQKMLMYIMLLIQFLLLVKK